MNRTSKFTSSSALLDHDVSRWILGKIDKLEGRAKFCSYNAVRFLRWANEIFETSHIVSSFCALNATEEAVAAFISAAKAHGHREHARNVNLHNHHSKALVSIFAQRCTLVAEQGKLAIALHPRSDTLAFRVPKGSGYHYGNLHLSAFRIHASTEQNVNEDIPLGDVPSFEEIEQEARRAAEARDKLLYATDNGYQTGFIEPGYEIARNTALSLGLIWAAVDMYMHPDQNRPFVEETLQNLTASAEMVKNRKAGASA